ncbi:MAG TPA: glycosyltransferase family 4 protein [Thermoplasmata archaeon]|nr:glycosyltransferase family 4 protein [Thermoplasmata archaeon]
MRITQVAPFYFPHAGGVESHVRSVVRELVREGHDVTVVTSRFRSDLPAEEEVDGYRIVRARSLGVLFNTPLDVGSGKVVRGLAEDVVHLHYPPPITSYVVARALRRARTPVCLTYHCDLFLPGISGRILAGLYQRVFLPGTLRRADAIVVHTRSYGVTSAELRDRALTVIPSVVELDRFRPGIDASGLRADLRLERRRVLAFTGRLVPHKGVDVILEAMRLLPDDVVLLVIGSGPLLPSLMAQARRLRLGDRVRFCPQVTDDELPRYLALAELFVFPSQNRLEGFGLAVAEAMACGLPVVTADMPGVREVIEPGKEGLLTEPLLARDVADKILRLLDDPAAARAMGAAGRRRAEERYGAPTVVGQLVNLYASLRAAG